MMEISTVILALLTLTNLSLGLPARDLQGIANTTANLRRDVCDGVGATPVLYHTYWDDVCIPKNGLMPNGHCERWDDRNTDCVSFCQVSKWIRRVRITSFLPAA